MDPVLKLVIGIFSAVTAAVLGSFMGVVCDRLPQGASIVNPPSHCDACGHRLAWHDMFPIFSYLFLKGKCRYCGAKIGPQTFLIELFSVLGNVGLYLFLGPTMTFVILALSWEVALGIAVIDWKTCIIPDSLLLALLVLGILAVFFAPFSCAGFTLSWVERLLGFGIGFALFVIFTAVARIVGHAVIGHGDLKLIAVFGLLIGWRLLMMGIVLGAMLALLVETVFARRLKREMIGHSRVLPFGPYLLAGFYLAFFVGFPFLSWYVTLFA